VTFVAATGDSGAPSAYPALSPNVLAVGGTHLNADVPGHYFNETGWSGSGGGVSAYEAKPSYQSGVTQSGTWRTNPDVAFDADPGTGVAIYDSNYYPGTPPWYQIGGTSFSAPAWAAFIAVTDQIRANHGAGPLDGVSR